MCVCVRACVCVRVCVCMRVYARVCQSSRACEQEKSGVTPCIIGWTANMWRSEGDPRTCVHSPGADTPLEGWAVKPLTCISYITRSCIIIIIIITITIIVITDTWFVVPTQSAFRALVGDCACSTMAAGQRMPSHTCSQAPQPYIYYEATTRATTTHTHITHCHSMSQRAAKSPH